MNKIKGKIKIIGQSWNSYTIADEILAFIKAMAINLVQQYEKASYSVKSGVDQSGSYYKAWVTITFEGLENEENAPIIRTLERLINDCPLKEFTKEIES